MAPLWHQAVLCASGFIVVAGMGLLGRLTNPFSEPSDDDAQRTFAWTFTSRTKEGATGRGSARCKASNHLHLATMEVRQVA